MADNNYMTTTNTLPVPTAMWRPNTLNTLDTDTLAALYGYADRRAAAHYPTSTNPAPRGWTLWLNRRQAVLNTCRRRGLTVHLSPFGEGRWMVGRAADFEPIERPA